MQELVLEYPLHELTLAPKAHSIKSGRLNLFIRKLTHNLQESRKINNFKISLPAALFSCALRLCGKRANTQRAAAANAPNWRGCTIKIITTTITLAMLESEQRARLLNYPITCLARILFYRKTHDKSVCQLVKFALIAQQEKKRQ